MAIEKLKIAEIYSKYENECFYVAYFVADDEQIFSDRSPYKAKVHASHSITNNTKYALVDTKNKYEYKSDYFNFMISTDYEELLTEYKKIKLKWIHGQKQKFNDEIIKLNLLEEEIKKCF